MINVKTFDLFVFFKGYSRQYFNISRTAVKYYIQWHQENDDFRGYDIVEVN
jgi:hypothetical protein